MGSESRKGGRRKSNKCGIRGKSAKKTTGSNDTKHIGNLAEMEFMLAAASRGFAVAQPYGDDEHYDFLVDAWPRIWRVQVKSAGAFRPRTFEVRSHWSGHQHPTPYTPADIDFIAAFVRPLRIWYLIPAKAIKHRFTLHLYPQGALRSAGEFEKYREAWHLLSGKPTER